jgi:hypothetical protein
MWRKRHLKNQEGDEIVIIMRILRSNNSNWSYYRIPTGAHFSRIQAICQRDIGNAVVGSWGEGGQQQLFVVQLRMQPLSQFMQR